MSKQIKVTSNTDNIGSGFWPVGKIFEVTGETPTLMKLANGSKINKRGMFVVGTSYFKNKVLVEVVQ